jgi:aminopeptidase N
MMKYLLVSLLGLGLFVGGCAREAPPPADAALRPERAPEPLLTREEAAYRKRVISEPAYALSIDLTGGDTGFAGVVEMSFNYAGAHSGTEQPLTLDFKNGQVGSVELNGEAVDYDYNGDFIALPAGSIGAGRQQLRIAYEHPYSQDGAGLYRYRDPQDGRIYLYTDFQPYDANRLFPHFDQPDLKARYTLSVLAPAHWQVVSTTREAAISSEGAARRWTFPATEPLSSYVFSLHAGDYAVFEDTAFRYPLRLFIRQSMRDYVDASFWFRITRQGFDFFDAYFGLPYPFGKYDQLIVPDFLSGAMENVAAVTFNEIILNRGASTRRERMSLAQIIMHEMAHMWFGDITTMAWWNGLWLNESFATVMEQLATAEGTEFTEAWHEFFTTTKQWAYLEDQLVTTHPIEQPVADTDEAFTNFDGITYGKGASVLKQLSFLLGAEVFRQGVQDYLAANAWDNTELEDFIGALASAAKRDLDEWARDWLYTAGLNSIQVEFACRSGLVSSMSLLQTAPDEHPVLREQRTRVALYTLAEGVLALEKTVPVLFKGARTTLQETTGSPCPDFVYPNYGDHAYIKVALDERSLATISEHIGGLGDPLQRSMAWHDLFSMVRDARLPLTAYLDILEANLATESDLNAASDLLWNLRSSFGYLRQVPSGPKLLPAVAERFERLLWRQVEGSRGDARQLWLAAYIDTASNEIAWRRLAGLLEGSIALDDFALDQDQRWAIVLKLSEYRWPGYEALVRIEAERDGSSRGDSNALKAEVLAARGEAKYRWVQRAVAADEAFTLQRSRDIASSLFPYSSQRQLAGPFAVEMLAMLPRLDEEHDVTFHDRVTDSLIPRLCREDNVQRLKEAAVRYADLNPAIVRSLRIAAQQDERCVRIGRLLEASG